MVCSYYADRSRKSRESLKYFNDLLLYFVGGKYPIFNPCFRYIIAVLFHACETLLSLAKISVTKTRKIRKKIILEILSQS